MTDALRTRANRGQRNPRIFHIPDPNSPGDGLCRRSRDRDLRRVDADDYPEAYYEWCSRCTQINQERQAEAVIG